MKCIAPLCYGMLDIEGKIRGSFNKRALQKYLREQEVTEGIVNVGYCKCWVL
jgi:hypothetical protein